MSVPGYEDKVEFGVLYTFAYPVDGHGECVETCCGLFGCFYFIIFIYFELSFSL